MSSGRDYADWLTPERLQIEDEQWRKGTLATRYAMAIDRVRDEHLTETGEALENVVEYGCGTGLIPAALGFPQPKAYVMFDRNPGCLALAVERNKKFPWCAVINSDLREILTADVDLACSFAVLKYFTARELISGGLWARLFGDAKRGVFSMARAEPYTIEDGTEFTHTRMSTYDVVTMVVNAGHEIVWSDHADPEEPIYATRRIR